MNKVIWRLVALNTALTLGHHVDHVLRHRAGWPFSEHVTVFTYSLVVYVVILVGVLLTRRGLVGAGYWALVAAAGFALVVVLHFGPLAKEHLSDLAGQYGGSRIKGGLAAGWLVLLLVSLAGTTLYCTRRWAFLGRVMSTPNAVQRA